MKKVNLLSRAEMKNVMGGTSATTGNCLTECSTSGAVCKNGEKTGVCTFYAPSPGCPNGDWACIVSTTD